MEHARVAMCHAFDLGCKFRVSALLPMAVYTVPEVAAVGETEETCRQKGIAYCVGRASYVDACQPVPGSGPASAGAESCRAATQRMKIW
jgi:pyruvate/2-oxoglutarate dehydrogenase complex dihydrolipoamide dehydrogenase (E3) component